MTNHEDKEPGLKFVSSFSDLFDSSFYSISTRLFLLYFLPFVLRHQFMFVCVSRSVPKRIKFSRSPPDTGLSWSQTPVKSPGSGSTSQHDPRSLTY